MKNVKKDIKNIKACQNYKKYMAGAAHVLFEQIIELNTNFDLNEL